MHLIKHYCITTTSSLIALLLIACNLQAANLSALQTADGHEIKLKIEGIKDTSIYLAHHYGKRIYVVDTSTINHKSTATFKGTEELPGGIYVIIVPGAGHFEILIDQNNQKFSITTDTTDYLNNIKIKGSPDNKLFSQYQLFIRNNRESYHKIKADRDSLDAKSLPQTSYNNKVEQANNALQTLNEQKLNKQAEVIAQHPNSFLAKLLQYGKEPEIPQAIQKDTINHPTRPLYYFKKHYFDNINFADSRIVRTPILYEKIDNYLKNFTPYNIDSATVSAERILQLAEANNEVFKQALNQVGYYFETAKIVGFDAVYIHILKNYYLNNKAPWLTEKQEKRMRKQVILLSPNLIGKTAPNFNLQTIDGKNYNLHQDAQADYTILHFWDYTCGHCKKSMPEYQKVYNKFKDQSIAYLSIQTKIEKEKFAEAIEKYNLEWINLYDPAVKDRFRQNYNVSSTPLLYILDKDKKIILKRIGPKQLNAFLSSKFKVSDNKK